MITSMLTTIKKNIRYAFQFLIASGVLLLGISQVNAQDLDVPYVPTPQNVVERMLDLAEVSPSDYVIDLGSGDGRIVIAAAKRGATGHGVDLDPKRIAEARQNAQSQGVDNQVMFIEGNIFNTEFSEASVITMYLLPTINQKLRPELLDKLEPGTKIVSHSFDMGDWEPDKEVTVTSDNGGGSHDIYYWVIPAKVNGTWNWSVNGTDFTMDVDQKYQEITVNLSDGNGTSYSIEKSALQGKRITVRAVNGDQNYIFSGRVEGDQIIGTMQHHNGDDKVYSPWSASR